ncbi:hypothetical protein MPTK1_1g25130 [Marchantia polymorpha subsp. ruderalis]|uniref:Uncharacterized protein n=2 Tax=Marchantia polymorpha TaxID=3197 RepID=A0AAF6AU35_MARPO|nr:hypothetical protein MARPO_0061s0012 [Marchantia polymorpha]BBM99955.1 hypothetical protein Mp_1g25130 [Marchantia polymorpha subsp. ruderalis]|eukprot:PTQ36731.1 hypothetical protein MARPO_0061s0012 [Marchantia polymorpha]
MSSLKSDSLESTSGIRPTERNSSNPSASCSTAPAVVRNRAVRGWGRAQISHPKQVDKFSTRCPEVECPCLHFSPRPAVPLLVVGTMVLPCSTRGISTDSDPTLISCSHSGPSIWPRDEAREPENDSGIDTEIENLDNRRSPPQQIRQHADENCVLMLAADASQHHDHRHRNGTVLDVRCQMLLRAFSPGGAFASELIDPSIHPSAQRTFPQHDSSSRACATRRRDERHSLLRPGDFSSPQNRDRKLQWLCFDCRPADLRCASCVSACPSDFGTGSRPRRASALDLRIPLESSISEEVVDNADADVASQQCLASHARKDRHGKAVVRAAVQYALNRGDGTAGEISRSTRRQIGFHPQSPLTGGACRGRVSSKLAGATVDTAPAPRPPGRKSSPKPKLRRRGRRIWDSREHARTPRRRDPRHSPKIAAKCRRARRVQPVVVDSHEAEAPERGPRGGREVDAGGGKSSGRAAAGAAVFELFLSSRQTSAGERSARNAVEARSLMTPDPVTASPAAPQRDGDPTLSPVRTLSLYLSISLSRTLTLSHSLSLTVSRRIAEPLPRSDRPAPATPGPS